MPLPLHLAIHFFVAVLVGYLAGRYFKKMSLAMVAAIMGGFFIDLDHVLEYFFYYGLHFNLTYFLEGRQFILSNTVYLIFHAWEYIPLLLLIAYLLRKKRALSIFIFTLCLAGAVHLVSDVFINDYPFKFYSISYRASQHFSTPKLISPEQYQKNLNSKIKLGF